MDKKVRRRRAVLGLLLAASLLLLTAYFGESAAGPFHSIQRGAFAVFSPVQDGASKVLKPARDAVGWFGDTLDARTQRDQLQKERDALLKRVVGADAAIAENKQLRALVGLDGRSGVSQYKPVTARVIGRSPTVWYSTLEVDKGSSDGVRVNQPVINGKGLVGKVKTVSDGNAVVMLLSDPDFGVSAVAAKSGQPGAILPVAGSPGDLLFDLVPEAKQVRTGDVVVTAGTVSASLPSPFPQGLAIGAVKRIEGEGELDRTIHVAPFADLRDLDFVRVLTKPTADLRASTTP